MTAEVINILKKKNWNYFYFIKNNFPLFLFILLIDCEILTAQIPTPVFRHFTSRDGLPSSEVYQALQDRKGFMWFATDRGVCRYNGYEFENFATEQGLPDNTIFFLHEDYKGRIWFVPSNKKLSYFENDKIHIYKYNDSLTTIQYVVPIGFKVTSNDEVIISLLNRIVVVIDSAGHVSIPDSLNGDPGKSIYKIENSFIYQRPKNMENSNKLTFNKVQYTLAKTDTNDDARSNVLKISANHFYISNSQFLYELKNNELKLIRQFNSAVLCLYVDKDNKVWVGTSNDGVIVLDGSNDFKMVHQYFDNTITSIFCDRENGIWFTSRTSGVYYLPEQHILNITTGQELKGDNATCVGSDYRNYIYAGYENGDVCRMNSSVFENLHSPVIFVGTGQRYDLLTDTLKNKIYISGNSNLLLFEKEKFRILNVNSFGQLYQQQNGTIWGGNISQFFKICNDTATYVCGNTTRIKSICELPDRRILLATILGVFEYKNGCDIQPFLPENVLLRQRADDIKVTSEGLILIATRGRGFLIIDNDSVYKISSQNGLASDFVQRVYIDGKDFWLATNRGISRIRLKDRKPLSYSVFTVRHEDGLPSDEVTGITMLHDTVWASTHSGIVFFNKYDLKGDSLTPDIYITSVSIDDIDTLVLKHFEIPSDKNNITLSFITPVFKGTSNVEYRYRVAGLENTWHYTKDRSIKLLSLPSGSYRFEVFAGNGSGVWSLSPAVISFCILPPFYQTWWFITCCIGFAGIVIYSYTNRRINRIRKTEKAKTEFNRKVAALEIKALRAQMNPHFTFNVMNSIQHYILQHDSSSAQKYLSKFAKLIRLILDNSEYDEVPLADELKALLLYVELEQLRFTNPFEFELTVAETINKNELMVPSLMLQPYVENAIKHGIIHLEKTGRIEVRIDKNAECILFTITDNGVGRAKSAEWNKLNVTEHISHGTTITRDRIQAYNTSKGTHLRVNIIDLKGSQEISLGTRVEIFIPLI